MLDELLFPLVLISALGSGLIAGVFFAFSTFVMKALARLPAESRAVFELRDVQGLSTQEAADVLGMTEANVRVRLHRVRQYLMGELESLHGGPGAPR